MRQIASTTIRTSVAPAALERHWARHRRDPDGTFHETQRLFLGSVRYAYRVRAGADGVTEAGADVAIGGVLQGAWALTLGPRIAAGLPDHLAREAEAARREAA